jgi:CheY-like chemotaxis protein
LFEDILITETIHQNALPQVFYNQKVLLIEDNEINIMLVSMLLKKCALQFDVAKTGSKALQLFNANEYNAVLTDIHLPELNGDEIAEIIRSNTNSKKANTPIIALTATSLPSDIQDYLDSGINDVMVKPFTEDDFFGMLKKHLTN